MTLKFDGWPWKTIGHLFYIASSFVHYFIATSEFKLERSIWVKINDFLSRMTLKFDGWPWKTKGHFSLATSIFAHHFIIICEFKFNLCDLDLWPLTLTYCMDITSNIGNNPWKYHVDTLAGTLWKRCKKRTDRRTEVFLELLCCS